MAKGNITLVFCLLLALGLLGGGIYFVYNRAGGDSAPALRPEAFFQELRDRTEQALQNGELMDFSVERNPNPFSCLYSAHGNCASMGGTFLLFDSMAANAPSLSQLTRDAGLNANAQGCRGFPSEQCPYQVQTIWSPICADDRCVNTKSFRVKAKVVYNPGRVAEKLEWAGEAMFSPNLRLSQAVLCQKEGKVWAGTHCANPGEVSERGIASGDEDLERIERMEQDRGSASMPAPVLPAVCAPEIELQGSVHMLEILSPGRAQVRLPAMNGCPAEDIFIFQCSPTSLSMDERIVEQAPGQWTQIEAMMAPMCDESGQQVGEDVTDSANRE